MIDRKYKKAASRFQRMADRYGLNKEQLIEYFITQYFQVMDSKTFFRLMVTRPDFEAKVIREVPQVKLPKTVKEARRA